MELAKDYKHATGEENEQVLLLVQVKLFRQDRENGNKYVECGAGPLKILGPSEWTATEMSMVEQMKKKKSMRVVMRRASSDCKAGTHVVLNQLLSSIVGKTILKAKNIIVNFIEPEKNQTTFSTYCIRILGSSDDANALFRYLKTEDDDNDEQEKD